MERIFKVIYGSLLMVFLAVDSQMGLYGLIVLLVFEGVTNIKFSTLLPKLWRGVDYKPYFPSGYKIDFEGERVTRLIFAIAIYVTYFMMGDFFWFLSWLSGFMLILAGITNLCPVIMTLKHFGFKC